MAIFETKGKSEEATEHCLAIGRMKPWRDDIEPAPLYRVNPKYPVNYARKSKEGSAIVAFDISPFGFVENARILESDGELFEKESLAAIKQWRYAPKFVEGEAVVAKGQKVRLDFRLGRPNRGKKLSNS